MEFLDPYLKDVGSLLSWLSKFETNITALQVVQGVAAILGIILSTLGIYKAWRYAEKRLGKRLDEFLNNEEEKVIVARHALQTAQKRLAVDLNSSPILPSRRELKAVLKPLGTRFFSSPKETLRDALERATEREALALKKSSLHQKQQAMIHLLLGAAASSENEHENALRHFRSALAIDAHDVEAIEYLGFQHLKAGDGDEALEQFEKLAEIAEARGDALLVSKALRNSGLAHQKCSPPSYFNANVAFRNAIVKFPNTGHMFELAHIYELRGLANIQQKRPKLASRCFERALTGYSALEHSGNGDAVAARAGVKRVVQAQEILRKLKAAATNSQAADEDDDDSNGSSTGEPSTHHQDGQHTPDGERAN